MRFSFKLPRTQLLAALFLAGAACLGAQAKESPVDSGVSLFIDSNPRGATVEINDSRAGVTPLSLAGYAPGSYSIRLSLAGYRDRLLELNAVAKTKYSYVVDLEPRLGTLVIEASPSDAAILFDGEASRAGTQLRRIGVHRISARRFGFETQERTVYLDEAAPQTVSLSLPKADFALSGASVSRRRFNPLALGSLGGTVFSFAVSAPGSGTLAVSSGSGTAVVERDFVFTDWDQSFRWDGRDRTGAPVPEGTYAISVKARGEDGIEASIEDSVRVDASARIEPRSLSSGSSGYALCPAAAVLPAGDGELATGLSIPLSADYSAAVLPFWTGFRFSLVESLELFASVHGAIGTGASSGLALSGGAKWQFLDRGRARGFDAAAFVSGVAALPGPLSQIPMADSGSSLRLALPCSATIGFLDSSLAPEFSLSFPASSRAVPKASLSAAIGFQAPFGDVHLSANAKYAIGGTSLDGPIRTALDARFLSTWAPLSLGAGLGLAIDQDGSLQPSLSLSLSLLI